MAGITVEAAAGFERVLAARPACPEASKHAAEPQHAQHAVPKLI